MAVSSSHGLPGPLILLELQSLDEYVKAVDETEKGILYDLLKSGDYNTIREKVDEIQEYHWKEISGIFNVG